MNPSPALCLSALALILDVLPAQTTPDDPNRVLVFYHRTWPDQNGDGMGDSEEVARYYATARNIPAARLVPLSITGTPRGWTNASAWQTFHDELVTPVKAALAAAGPTKIDTLVFCYGVPYFMNIPVASNARRAVDSLIQVPNALGDRTTCPIGTWFSSNPYLEPSPSVLPDKGRFDHATYRFSVHDMYLVHRLDGTDVDAAKDLIDGARYGELHEGVGVGRMPGNAYIDTRYGYYTDAVQKAGYPFGYTAYQNADHDMAFGKFFPPLVGLPTYWEASGAEIGETGAVWQDNSPALRARAAFLYGGWYNYGQYVDAWEWLPGSIACDLNSNSINGYENAYTGSFLASAFARGLSAGCGVVAEPYLNGHTRPEVLLYYLVQGFTFAEAASLSQPSLFWQTVNMGDPLYAPYSASRVRVADTTPPPLADAGVVDPKGSSATLRVVVPRRPADPDLCTCRLEYGTAATALTTTVDHGTIYRSRHDFALAGIPDVPGLYYRVALRDPVGQTTQGPLWAMNPRAFTGFDVRAHAEPSSVAYAAPLTLRFAASTDTDFSTVTAFRIELEVGTQRVDITDYVFAGRSEVAVGPRGRTVLLAMHVPAYLPAASYKLHITAATASQSWQHTALFQVQ
ncbi:MAG: hypothetical protein H6837_13190 [Planctomycetes bacterium]|nr:hypothetical protein [Planctomycetota bacterium]